jgi:Na+-transporting methylmalonyl-CoA/oxaloacetate decarboxylase gamma subunit
VSWISTWWQQVSGAASQGLQITFVGMTLVFLTLGSIILVLNLLTRLPRLQTKREGFMQDGKLRDQLSRPHEAGRSESPAETIPTTDELARIAAIAVALAHSQHRESRAARPRPTTGKWKQYGRSHQLGL